MKILVAGDGGSDLHERAVVQALLTLGHNVASFYWTERFRGYSKLGRNWLRLQNKYLTGPAVWQLNAEFVNCARDFDPDVIFVYRGTHVTAEAIRMARQAVTDCVIVGYNNDDPFAPQQPRRLWRHFVQAIPEYDIVFAYRRHNLEEFRRAGARRAELLMPWFVSDPASRPIAESHTDTQPACDVVFIGHYEADHRLGYLKALSDSPFSFRLLGPDWHRAAHIPWVRKLGPIHAVRGAAYYEALRSAKIALAFFSTLNRDTYTRRSFEIPASGTFMLSQHSDEIARLFRERTEAEFFRTVDEMLSKIDHYLKHDHDRARIAAAGHRRVYQDRHDIESRMRHVINLCRARRTEVRAS